MITLYAYVDGSDLADVEQEFMTRLTAFVEAWGVSTAHVVNMRRERSPDLREDDLPDWHLGLNFTVDHLPRQKVQELVRFLHELGSASGRDFAIGAGGEDWTYVGPGGSANAVELLSEQLA